MLHPEAPFLLRAFLLTHIVAGSIALFVVPIALAVRKGGAVHRRFGRVFVYAMGTVGTTALVCGPYFHDYFLLLIAVFSTYLTFQGARALARKRPGSEPAAAIDWAGSGLAFAAGLGMSVMGILGHAAFGAFSVVLVVLGAGCAGFATRAMIRYRRPPVERGAWLIEHFTMMLGAYIAAVTAFSVVNLHFLNPVWVRWLWPTALGTVLITLYTIRHKTQAQARPALLRERRAIGR